VIVGRARGIWPTEPQAPVAACAGAPERARPVRYRHGPCYAISALPYRPRRRGVWANALAAADLAAALARGFCRVADAFEAAGGDVTFFGAPVCESALAAALFALALALGFCIVVDALDAARLPVSFDMLVTSS